MHGQAFLQQRPSAQSPRGVVAGGHRLHTPRAGVLARALQTQTQQREQQQQQASLATSSMDGEVPPMPAEDPEAKFRRYGKFFGARGYKFFGDMMNSAPRVRVRTISERQREELLELALLNERLAGEIEPWEARHRLEFLRAKRRDWEAVYNYVTKQDAVATLALIEEACSKVEDIVSEESREHMSVTSLKQQLVAVQQQVEEARVKLQVTQARVESNLQRVDELKAEAAALERIRASSAPVAVATATATTSQATQGSATTTVLAPPLPAPRAKARRTRGLHSSLEIEEPLKNFWYPAEFSSKLKADTLVPFDIFGEPWVLFRDEAGRPSCVKDECAHRACPLSLGKVVDGKVECAYHGWQFDATGTCTTMPSTKHCSNIAVSALPCMEKDGFVWVWPGAGVPPEVPSFTLPPEGFQIHAEIMVDVPVEHGLLMENLLDLAHAPFTHTSTFARGWPIPDMVKFHTNKVLSGAWDPYPIDMAFQPPCMVVSMIGLMQPGQIVRGGSAADCKKHLHQLHVCMPSKKGHTRLLYRMSLDFMPWLRSVPFIDLVWKDIAGQVLGEDLKLVKGQQERLEAGGDTWNNPVSYDKLGVRYRRWRNAVAAGAKDQQVSSGGSIPMSSGELFSLQDDSMLTDLSSSNLN